MTLNSCKSTVVNRFLPSELCQCLPSYQCSFPFYAIQKGPTSQRAISLGLNLPLLWIFFQFLSGDATSQTCFVFSAIFFCLLFEHAVAQRRCCQIVPIPRISASNLCAGCLSQSRLSILLRVCCLRRARDRQRNCCCTRLGLLSPKMCVDCKKKKMLVENFSRSSSAPSPTLPLLYLSVSGWLMYPFSLFQPMGAYVYVTTAG